MSSDPTRNQLEQAYRLIQQEELDKAIVILRPVVSAQPNNLDAWWLMANAVSEPDDAREALNNVLRIDPNHRQARELLNELNAQFPAYQSATVSTSFAEEDPSLDDIFRSAGVSPAEDIVAPSPVDAEDDFAFIESPQSFGTTRIEDDLSPSFDDQFDFGAVPATSEDPFQDPFAGQEPDFLTAEVQPAKKGKQAKPPKASKPQKMPKQAVPLDPLEVERRANRRTSPLLLIAILLVIIVVLGGGFTLFILPRLVAPEATSVAGGPVINPVTNTPAAGETPTADSSGTDQTPVATTAGSTGGDKLADAVKSTTDLFAANQFQNAKADVISTEMGETLNVEVCGVAGPRLQANVNKAMDILAQEAYKIRDSIKGAAVEFINCASGDTRLFRAMVDIATITTYVDGSLLNKRDYRAKWQK
jgi:hypothetical protein